MGEVNSLIIFWLIVWLVVGLFIIKIWLYFRKIFIKKDYSKYRIMEEVKRDICGNIISRLYFIEYPCISGKKVKWEKFAKVKEYSNPKKYQTYYFSKESLLEDFLKATATSIILEVEKQPCNN